jgi:hypothetical protein
VAARSFVQGLGVASDVVRKVAQVRTLPKTLCPPDSALFSPESPALASPHPISTPLHKLLAACCPVPSSARLSCPGQDGGWWQ